MLNLHELERQIEAHMTVARVPGLAIAIIQDRLISYARGFGLTSVEDGGLPVTPQTLFRIGSITKSMTATMIMRLVESGRLNLDRPVTEYIPWLTFSQAVSVGFIPEGESQGDSPGDLLVQFIQINSSPCQRFSARHLLDACSGHLAGLCRELYRRGERDRSRASGSTPGLFRGSKQRIGLYAIGRPLLHLRRRPTNLSRRRRRRRAFSTARQCIQTRKKSTKLTANS